MRAIQLLAPFFACLSVSASAAPPGYFDAPRRGANYFNSRPTEQWFDAARAANIRLVRLTFSKWPSATDQPGATNTGRFLIGADDEKFDSLVAEDLKTLRTALDWAAKREIRVIICPLTIPGAKWRQQNDGKFDARMWSDAKYHALAARFWNQLAAALKDHPAVAGYDLLNEPWPERALDKLDEEDAAVARFYEKRKNTPADVNVLYAALVAAVRQADKTTPIIVEPSSFAWPGALKYLRPIDDPHVLYSFHAYAPYTLVNWKQNGGKYAYPGDVPVDGKTVRFDRNVIAAACEPIAAWAKANKVPASRIFVGEFGCDRRVKGCAQLLADTT